MQALREEYPHWGEKLRVLLAREGVILSAKSIDRVSRLMGCCGSLYNPGEGPGGTRSDYDVHLSWRWVIQTRWCKWIPNRW